MKMEPSKILEGLKNHLLPSKEAKEMIESVAKERLSICKNCEFNTTPGQIKSWSRCDACGCFLRIKTKCLSCNCGIESYNEDNNTQLPLKWRAVISKEENDTIQTLLKENDST